MSKQSAASRKWDDAGAAGKDTDLAQTLAEGAPDMRGLEGMAIFKHRSMKTYVGKSGKGTRSFAITTVIMLADVDIPYVGPKPKDGKSKGDNDEKEVIPPADGLDTVYHAKKLYTLTVKEFTNINVKLVPNQVVRLKGLKAGISRDTKAGNKTYGQIMFNLGVGGIEPVPGMTLEEAMKGFTADQRFISTNPNTSHAEDLKAFLGDAYRPDEYAPGRAVIFDVKQRVDIDELEAQKKYFCVGQFTQPKDSSWLTRINGDDKAEICLRGAQERAPNVVRIAQGGAGRLEGEELEVIQAYTTVFKDDFACLGIQSVEDWAELGVNIWKGIEGKYVGNIGGRTSAISADEYATVDNKCYVQGSLSINIPKTMKNGAIQISAAQALKYLQVPSVDNPVMTYTNWGEYKAAMRPDEQGVNLSSFSGNLSRLVKADNVAFYICTNHTLSEEDLAAIQALETPEERNACITSKPGAKVRWSGPGPSKPKEFKFYVFAVTTDKSAIRHLLAPAAASAASYDDDDDITPSKPAVEDMEVEKPKKSKRAATPEAISDDEDVKPSKKKKHAEDDEDAPPKKKSKKHVEEDEDE